MRLPTFIGASCDSKTTRYVTSFVIACSLGLMTNVAIAVPVPTGAFALVFQTGGAGYGGIPDPLDLGSSGGYTFQPTSEASGSGNDGFVYASSSLGSGTVRLAATINAAFPYNTLPSGYALGGMRDIVNFDLGGNTNALVSFSGHVNARIAGPTRIEYRYFLSRCAAAGCESGMQTTVAIYRDFFSDVDENLLFDNGGAGYLILSGFDYLVDFRVTAYVGNGGMLSGLDTFGLGFVLPEGVTFTSRSGVFLTATDQPPTSVPEPGVLALLLLGLAGVGIFTRDKSA